MCSLVQKGLKRCMHCSNVLFSCRYKVYMLYIRKVTRRGYVHEFCRQKGWENAFGSLSSQVAEKITG